MKHTPKNTKPYKKSEPAESGRARQGRTVSEPDVAPMPVPNIIAVTHEDLRRAMEAIRREIPRNTISEDKFFGAIGALDGKIEALRGELGGEIKGLDGKIEALRGELGGKIEAQDGKIDTLRADLGGKIEAQDGKIDTLRAELVGEIKGLYGKIEAQDGKIDTLRADLGGEMKGLDGKIEALRGEIKGVHGKIEALSENMVTFADFNRQNTTMMRYFITLIISLLGAMVGLLFWLSRFLPPYPG